MDICKTILGAITQALECEENRLQPRSGQERRPWTVSGVYSEDWVCYLLIKELAERCPPEWEFDREKSRVDLLICGHATVELKGPHRVDKSFHKEKDPYKQVLKDFKKQKCRAKEAPNLEHFVLLILHATKDVFDSGCFQYWLDQLKLIVQENNSDICIRLQRSKPLVLNGDKPRLLQCCLYRVC